MHRPAARYSNGFTLVEAMAVLLIASLLLAAGVPALQDAMARQRLTNAAQAFFHAAALARAHALRQGGAVRMVPADGQDWRSGWRVESTAISDGTTPPLHLHPSLPSGITVTYATGGALIAYRPTGQPATRGSWTFSAGGQRRVVIINFLGRLRLCDPAADSSCQSSGS